MKTKQWLMVGLLGLVSVQFGVVGVLKVAGFAPLYQQLAALHVGRTAGLLIGIAEVLGVAGLWVKPLRRYVLLALLLLVVGAVGCTVGAGLPVQDAAPALFSTVVLLTLLYLTQPTSTLAGSPALRSL